MKVLKKGPCNRKYLNRFKFIDVCIVCDDGEKCDIAAVRRALQRNLHDINASM